MLIPSNPIGYKGETHSINPSDRQGKLVDSASTEKSEPKNIENVPYGYARTISPVSGKTEIKTDGLKPCVGLLLVCKDKNGNPIASIIHIPAKYASMSVEDYKKEVQKLIQEAIEQMKKNGADIKTLKVVLSGRINPKEPVSTLDNFEKKAQENAQMILTILGEQNIHDVQEHYNKKDVYRTLTYNRETDKFTITESTVGGETLAMQGKVYKS